MFKIRRLLRLSKAQFEEYRDLIHQLSPDRQIRRECVDALTASASDIILGVFDGAYLLGTGRIHFLWDTDGYSAMLEDIVVHENFRGLGIGRRLVHALHAAARSKRALRCKLISRGSRGSERALYRSLRYTEHDTTVFTCVL